MHLPRLVETGGGAQLDGAALSRPYNGNSRARATRPSAGAVCSEAFPLSLLFKLVPYCLRTTYHIGRLRLLSVDYIGL
jgi:hypothetical protein